MTALVASREPLDRFISSFGAAVERAAGDEPALFALGRPLMADLIAHDDWLPPEFADPRGRDYGSYLLYADPAERFVVVSFAWGADAVTPIHDHTVWGMIGVLRGCEISRRYAFAGGALVPGGEDRLEAGMIDAVSPAVGDIHQVRNGCATPSVSIHVYGADLVKRPHLAYDARSGKSRTIFSAPFLNQSALIAHL